MVDPDHRVRPVLVSCSSSRSAALICRVISVLNACTGTAVAMSGLAINNIALIVAGALVGSGGCDPVHRHVSRPVNRPLLSVLAGGFGGANAAAAGAGGVGRHHEGNFRRTIWPSSSSTRERSSSCRASVWQAQAQRELADLAPCSRTTASKSPTPSIRWQAVCWPYERAARRGQRAVPEELIDLDDINPQFPQANVALVVGANDVTNPAARKPGTPVSSMPILDVDKAQNVVVMKRGRGTGYAGIQNELYFRRQHADAVCDARASLQAVIAAVKEPSTDGPACRLREIRPSFGEGAFVIACVVRQTGMGWIGGNCPLYSLFKRIVTERWTK